MDNYNHLVEKYDAYGKETTTDWALGYPNVVKFLTPLKGKVVLDYGCGTGKFCRYISDKVAKVIGVDTSEKMIQTARKYESESIEYHHIDSGKLDFIESSSIDSAVLNFVTCTIPSSAEIVKILKEINRVLRKDSVLVILNVNWEECNGQEFISYKLDYVKNLTSGKKVSLILKSTKPLRVEDYFWSGEDYLEMLKESNFKIKTTQEPIAQDDSQKWVNEDKCSPFLIIVGEK